MSDFDSDPWYPSWDELPRWLQIVLRILGIVLVICAVGFTGMVIANLYMTGKPF